MVKNIRNEPERRKCLDGWIKGRENEGKEVLGYFRYYKRTQGTKKAGKCAEIM